MKIETQNAAILKALKRGHRLTALKALARFGCMRLGARIWDLKEQGYKITSKLVKDAKTGKRFAEYRMNVPG